MELTFIDRNELTDFEWELKQSFSNRLDIDKQVIRDLSARSNLYGLWRLLRYVGLLVLAAWGAVAAARITLWAAIPPLYAYWFLYGFWVAPGHEFQHKMVFDRSWGKFSDFLWFFVQAFMWNSPRYARVSHQLHHRYTMVRGKDPETDWPEVFDRTFVRRTLRSIILQIVGIRVLPALWHDIRQQVRRIAGHKDWMMRDFCSEEDCRRIRVESAAILLFHVGIVGLAIMAQSWWPILFITLAHQIGAPMESLWHITEHIGRAYNVNDQRLATRSIKVSPFIHMLYWGLDDHVDHHLFPSVTSRYLPKLHQLLKRDLPEPRTMVQCWKEMLAIGNEKSIRPQNEYIPPPVAVTPQ
jgi:fatty acid desaturase